MPANVDTLVKFYQLAQADLIQVILGMSKPSQKIAILREVNIELAKLQKKTVDWVESEIPKTYREGMDAVNQAIKAEYVAAGKEAPIFPTEFAQINKKAINLLVENASADFNHAVNFIGRRCKDDIRAIANQMVTKKIAEGLTIDQLKRDLEKKYAEQGISAIKYRSRGRDCYMNMNSYAEMVARSTSAEATNIATRNQTQEVGEDLVQITSHSSSCPICAVYEGRVYSISGSSEAYPPLETAFSSGYANIHPRCRHALVPYIEDLKTPEELKRDRAFSNRSFDPEKWSAEEQSKYKKNLAAYEEGQKKARALYSDRQQFERYRAALPNSAPKTFSGFRRMKNADSDSWKDLQANYRASRRESLAVTNRGVTREDIQQRFPSLSSFQECMKSGGYTRDNVQGWMNSITQCGGRPKIISRSTSDLLEKRGSIRIYRGLDGDDHDETLQFVDAFKRGEFFPGVGVSGNGTYTTTSRRTARGYARGYDPGVIEMILPRSARTISHNEITRLRQIKIASLGIDKNDFDTIVRTIYSDDGRYALSLGYDAIEIPAGIDETYYVILNRSILKVIE